jgi:serpin B
MLPKGSAERRLMEDKIMKRTGLVLFAVLFAVLWSLPVISAESTAPSQQAGLEKGNNDYSVQLYRELAGKPGNLFISPYSISSALAMTYAAARGNTAKEIKETMRFPFDQSQLNGAFKSLNRDLMANAGKDGLKLNIANGLCLTGGNVSKEYRTILKEDYDAELFSGGLERINGWVKQKTEGKIPKILDQLDANSVCVILNAVYFKGAWESQFSTIRTFNAPFHVSADKMVDVPLMYQKNEYRFLDEKDFQVLSMPYKGNRLSMVIFLPKSAGGLPAFEKGLTAANLEGWLAGLDKQEPAEIKLFLPRFKIETGYDLVPACMNMGMKDAFGSAADFTGMGWPVGDLWISQIKHKAFAEVNEEGTEAAAATAVEMVTKGMSYDPVFRADHPFMFLIRDNKRGAILFMGRLSEPAGK